MLTGGELIVNGDNSAIFQNHALSSSLVHDFSVSFSPSEIKMIAKAKRGGGGKSAEPLPAKLKRDYFTQQETEEQLGLSYSTLYRLRNSDDPTFEKETDWIEHGNRIFFRKTSVLRYQNSIAK